MAKAGLLVGSYATIKENEGTNWKVIDSSKVFVGDDIYSVSDLVPEQMERFVGLAPSECELVAVGNAINWYGSGADRAGEFVMQADYFSFK